MGAPINPTKPTSSLATLSELAKVGASPGGPEVAGKALANVMRVETKPLPAAGGTLVVSNPAPMELNELSGRVEYGVLREEKRFEPQLDTSRVVERERVLREQVPPSSESYTAIVENELKDVLREPLSTFSIDVDTASYANVRRFLNQNMLPPKDAVRIEELVNYFPTNEEGPAAEAKEPFATRVELAACPWQPRHKLARISIQGREIAKSSKASNLVFLVDVSGSMNDPQKLPLVQQSLRMLAEQLGESDRVAMVTYASGTQVVLPPTGGERRSQIISAVDQLRAGGSTNGAGGLQLAYEQAVAGFVQGGINRVILCTDGDFNVGISDPAQLEKFIADKARSGVFLSVLGFGSGNLKDRTMETLANKGNGNYAYIDGLGEARKVLVEQMSGTLVTIAKDVKIQIEFNPAMVRSYRLIGYENRLLAKEDFNDDTKDAGEIGSGHSVVALYELVPANLQPGEEPARIVDTLKYQTLASPMPDGTMPKLNKTAQETKEVMTVKLRYKQPEGETSQKIEVPVMDADKAITAASAEFKFSAAVAAFGLLLRDSGYKGQLTWEAVRALALEGKGPDKLGYRGEFLQLIDKAAGLKGTRP
ncbi:MAG: VWA domain-containing protein [Verrucomicrobiaceae bacterium]|nr:VWA domain-containing protein [Verrucomicrobiaceae bacterium]